MMICLPPTYKIAACPRLATRNMNGNRNVNKRETAMDCSIVASAACLNFTCCCFSRVNALITLMPARFSCSTVFNAESFCCTFANIGCAMLAKTPNNTIATGRMGMAVHASETLDVNKIMTVPVNSITAPTNCKRPCPINRRTFSTSSVARIIN